jgi:tetratricopeptide (TPR) repeat protein
MAARAPSSAGAEQAEGTGRAAAPPLRWAALGVAHAVLAFWVYRPALRGAFVSDDIGYVSGNPWIHALTWENARAILDPFGAPAAHTANWAPVHLLLHALGWSAFGGDPFGHHVVNVLAHVGATLLVGSMLVRAGLPFAWAAGCGTLFLVHPANVEAVAWIFQLKTVASLALATAALLAEPRRPLLATALFALALLTKIQVVFALPVAAIAAWIGWPRDARPRAARLAWLAAWAVVLALVLVPEMAAFERLGHFEGGAPEGAAERVRMAVALLGRYLAMAATSFGVAAFHQPDPPASWLDAWWLAGLAGALAMAARALVAWRRQSVEAALWAWVAGAFLPVAQIFGFLYPMGDRYLYPVLPGLLGALAIPLHARLARAGRAGSLALALAVLALGAAFALRSHERAAVWRSEATLSADAVAHYPEGLPAQLERAAAAARAGDVEAAVAALRAAHARGFDRFVDLERDPGFARLHDDPRFAALLHEVARTWIARVEGRSDPTLPELVMLGQAYATLGEWDRALALLEQAARAGGPGSELARAALPEVRARRLRAERAAKEGAAGEGAGGAAPR